MITKDEREALTILLALDPTPQHICSVIQERLRKHHWSSHPMCRRTSLCMYAWWIAKWHETLRGGYTRTIKTCMIANPAFRYRVIYENRRYSPRYTIYIPCLPGDILHDDHRLDTLL